MLETVLQNYTHPFTLDFLRTAYIIIVHAYNITMYHQNLILFIRGDSISGAPSIKGTNQFPNAPIRIGVTIRKLLQKHEQLQLHYRFDHLQLGNLADEVLHKLIY